MHPTFDLVIPVFGTLKIAFTQADHCHVSGDITVRGIQHHISMHLFEHPSDNRFHLGREGQTPYELYQQLYSNRRDVFKPSSEGARRAIQKEVELAANNFIVNNRSVLFEAQRQKLLGIVESAKRDAEEAYQKWDKAEEARQLALAAYAEFMGGNQ